jgi:TIR domain-containing protein
MDDPLSPAAASGPASPSKEFLTLLSSERQGRNGSGLARIARHVQESLVDVLDPPQLIEDGDLLASADSFSTVVQILCRARVVLIDISRFEPAMMLITGIRFVTRRGVTVLSTDSTDFSQSYLPLTLTGVDISSHCSGPDLPNARSLEERLRVAIEQFRLTPAADTDNDVYHAARRPRTTGQGIIPRQHGTIALCSSHEEYTHRVWRPRLRRALEYEQQRFDESTSAHAGYSLGIVRRCDETQIPRWRREFYGYVRDAQACVVDLTDWSPDVMFDFGVRLAICAEGTACLLEKHDLAKTGRWTSQAEQLASLFVEADGLYDGNRPWTNEPAYRNAYGPDAVLPWRNRLCDGSLHRAIAAALPTTESPSELPDAAEPATLFRRSRRRDTVFVCYRRDDTADAAGRLHDRLVAHYGEDRAFIDIDGIPLGVNFVDYVADKLERCAAVVVMIGNRWAGITDERGNRRLDDPTDHVRIEIATALKLGIPVIPILVHDALMPKVRELPGEIQQLALRNGTIIRRELWHQTAERLIQEIDLLITPEQS